MKLAIFGATGPLGQELVKQALARGHSVRLLIRRAIPPGDLPKVVELIRGNYFDPAAIRETLVDAQAVLSTIGPPQHRTDAVTPKDYGQAMEHLIAEMKRIGISRIINVASTATRFGSEPYGWGRRLLRLVLRYVAPVVIPGKEHELAVLSQSGLNWTSVRPPMIRTGIGGEIRANAGHPQRMRVDQELLATFMLDQLDGSTWMGKAPFVGS